MKILGRALSLARLVSSPCATKRVALLYDPASFFEPFYSLTTYECHSKYFVKKKSTQTALTGSVNIVDTSYPGESTLSDWKNLIENPNLWCDFRIHKQTGLVSTNHPGFKRKDGKHILWVNTVAQSLLSELDHLKFDEGMSKKNQDTTLNSWKHLIKNPNLWSDYRTHKKTGLVKPTYPDFKRMDGNDEGLWLDSVPDWVLSGLEQLDFQAPKIYSKGESTSPIWKNLIENPNLWCDYRTHKKAGLVSAKHPDFKSKDGKQNLWVDTIPQSLLSELDSLKFDEGESTLPDWKKLIENPNLWCDYRTHKKAGLVSAKHPDFKSKDGKQNLWVDTIPQSLLSELDSLKFDEGKLKNSREANLISWKHLIENPKLWSDYRAHKTTGLVKPTYPDFKKMDGNDEVLWLDSAPDWVLSGLEQLEFQVPKIYSKGEFTLPDWKNLIENPNLWCDYRTHKQAGLVSSKHPDFKSKDGKHILWVDTVPQSLLSELDGLEFDEGKSKNSLEATLSSWKHLIENPKLWCDYRTHKTTGLVKPTYPDFKRMDGNDEGLWLDSAPNWVFSGLEQLEFEVPKIYSKGESILPDWKNLIENPNLWCDYRTHKQKGLVSAKHPDFKSKDGKQILWVDTAPQSLLSEIDGLKFDEGEATLPECKNLIENSNLWCDYRTHKQTGLVSAKHPDFKSKDGKQILWVDMVPQSILSELGVLKFDEEDLWKSLMDQPDEWWDNRMDKRQPNTPDFKHKVTGIALWLQNCPAWAQHMFT